MDFAPKVQGQKILLPIIPKSSKNLMQFGGGATFPTVYPAYITDTINSTATNQRSSIASCSLYTSSVATATVAES